MVDANFRTMELALWKGRCGLGGWADLWEERSEKVLEGEDLVFFLPYSMF